MTALKNAVEIGLNAVIVTLLDANPSILRMPGSDDVVADALPYGPFDSSLHRTMETGLRRWVAGQTGLKLGFCEQLYAFADRGRQSPGGNAGAHVVSIGYLALVRNDSSSNSGLASVGASWKSWYAFLPWEDWRKGRPAQLDELIIPALRHWANHEGAYATADEIVEPAARIRLAFGLEGLAWDEQHVVERFELMYAAGLVEESVRDGHCARRRVDEPLGSAMAHDHRRMLATAIARLRGKLKYRPVVFELMAEEFTLTQLQQSVENICGRQLHKQNFRRQVDNSKLVEPTGETTRETGGRPAALYRFQNEAAGEY